MIDPSIPKELQGWSATIDNSVERISRKSDEAAQLLRLDQAYDSNAIKELVQSVDFALILMPNS